MPTLSPVMEAILLPSIRRIRTETATQASTTTSLGSKASGPDQRAASDSAAVIVSGSEIGVNENTYYYNQVWGNLNLTGTIFY